MSGYADAVELAWGVIANVGGGDWSTQSPEWGQAARRWHDTFMVRAGKGDFGTLDETSFIACECDRTEDVRLEGGCIADGEVARLRLEGWFYDGVTWVCPTHAKDIIASVPLG